MASTFYSARNSLHKPRIGAFPLLMESEAELYDIVLTGFHHASRYPLRSKTL